jgi:carbonic anhydrase
MMSDSRNTAGADFGRWRASGKGPGRCEGKYINWPTIKGRAESVAEVLKDVVRINFHPLVPADIPVYGFICDSESGRRLEGPAATEAGRAS